MRFATKQEVIDFFVNNNGKMSAMFIDDECKLLMCLKKDETNRYQFIDKELEKLRCPECAHLIKNSGTNKGCIKHRSE